MKKTFRLMLGLSYALCIMTLFTFCSEELEQIACESERNSVELNATNFANCIFVDTAKLNHPQSVPEYTVVERDIRKKSVESGSAAVFDGGIAVITNSMMFRTVIVGNQRWSAVNISVIDPIPSYNFPTPLPNIVRDNYGNIISQTDYYQIYDNDTDLEHIINRTLGSSAQDTTYYFSYYRAVTLNGLQTQYNYSLTQVQETSDWRIPTRDDVDYLFNATKNNMSEFCEQMNFVNSGMLYYSRAYMYWGYDNGVSYPMVNLNELNAINTAYAYFWLNEYEPFVEADYYPEGTYNVCSYSFNNNKWWQSRGQMQVSNLYLPVRLVQNVVPLEE